MLKIIYLELTILLRNSHAWLYPLAFFLITVCLFPLAFSPDPDFLQKYIPGCVWIAALLASLLSVQTIFLSETEDGYLDQLLLSDGSITFIILTKLIAYWTVTSLPLILITPILSFMFGITTNTLIILALTLLLGTPILTLIGTLSVALTLSLKQQGMVLGLIMLPLVIPVLIFGVTITQQSTHHLSVLAPIAFLAGISLLAITLIPFVIMLCLRIAVDD